MKIKYHFENIPKTKNLLETNQEGFVGVAEPVPKIGNLKLRPYNYNIIKKNLLKIKNLLEANQEGFVGVAEPVPKIGNLKLRPHNYNIIEKKLTKNKKPP